MEFNQILRKKSKSISLLRYNTSRYSTTIEKCELLGHTFCQNHSYSANLGDVTTENLVEETIRTFNANSSRGNEVLITNSKISAIIKGLKYKKTWC